MIYESNLGSDIYAQEKKENEKKRILTTNTNLHMNAIWNGWTWK